LAGFLNPSTVEPENGGLESVRFLLGPGPFSGALAVSFREFFVNLNGRGSDWKMVG